MNLAKSAAKKMAQAQKNAKIPAQLGNKHMRTSRLKMTKQAPRLGKQGAGGEGASVQSITRRQYYALTLENFNSPNTTKILELAQRKRGFLRLYCNARRYKVHGLAVETELARTKRDLDKFATNIHQMSKQLGNTRDELRKFITLHRKTQDHLRGFHQFSRGHLGADLPGAPAGHVIVAEEEEEEEESLLALPGEDPDLAPAITEALAAIEDAPEDVTEDAAEEGAAEFGTSLAGEGEEEEVKGAALLDSLDDIEGFWYVQAADPKKAQAAPVPRARAMSGSNEVELGSSPPLRPPPPRTKRMSRIMSQEQLSSLTPATNMAALSIDENTVSSTSTSLAPVDTTTTTTQAISSTGIDPKSIDVALAPSTTSSSSSPADEAPGFNAFAYLAMNRQFSRGDPRSRLLRTLQVGGTSSRFLSQPEVPENVVLIKEQAAQRLVGKLDGLNLLILKDLQNKTSAPTKKKSRGFGSFGRF
jgi:hypothetical protein